MSDATRSQVQDAQANPVPVNQPYLQITASAAAKIKELLAKEGKGAEYGLRLGVMGGGCSGLQYFMEFDTTREGDRTIEMEGAKVFVDPRSSMHVRGSQLEYLDGLHGAGFKISNPNVKSSCGCGHSFQT